MENVNVSPKRVKELSEGAPKQGLVEIRLKDPKKTGTITVRGYKEVNGQHRPYVDQYGQNRIMKISKTLFLDMVSTDDRLTLQQVANHPIYIKGQWKSLVIVNHEAAAEKLVSDKDSEARAMGIIQKLEGEDLKDFARVLLVTVKPGSSDRILKSVIYEKAAEDPKGILKEWDNPLREHKALLRKGIEKGVFTNRQGRYLFKDQLMGTSFDLATDWIKENEDLMPQLRKEIK
jgi:hypothetical protein